MNEPPRERWSDAKLEEFYQEHQSFRAEFRQHMADEDRERRQQEELYAALFQIEQPEKNVPAGVIQLLSRVAKDVSDMKIANDRQKRFVGGIVFAIGSMGFFLTDTFSKLADILRRL